MNPPTITTSDLTKDNNHPQMLGQLISCLLMISFQLGLYYIGKVFLIKQLYQDYDIKTNINNNVLKISSISIQAAFSITFSFSGALCFLMLFEIMELMPEFRLWYWKLCLWVSLFMVILVLPICQIYMLTKKLFSGLNTRNKSLFIATIWGGFFFLFWSVGHQNDVSLSNTGFVNWLFVQCLSRVGVLGVALISVLSGFGAVYNSYIYLPLKSGNLNMDLIQKNEIELTNTLQMVVERRKELAKEKASVSKDEGSSSGGNFISSVISFSQSLTQRNSSAIQSEIDTLETLERQINSDSELLQRRKERAQSSGTWEGRIMDFLGYILAFYCVYRIFMSLINIIFNRRGQSDPITTGLSVVVAFWNVHFDKEFWAQQLSFLLIGILVVSSIRSLLIYFMKITKLIRSETLKENLILFLAQTMGMYFISTVLLMRANLPVSYREALSLVLGNIQFDFYHQWFDIVFVVSSFVSILVIYLTYQQLEMDAMF